MIYKLKDDVDFNILAKLGWDVLPNSDGATFFKIVPQPFDGELVQGSIKNFYQHPKFIENYNKNKKIKKQLSETLGLKYNKKGEVIMNDKFKQMLINWRIQVDNSDKELNFTSLDCFDNNCYYATEVIDKYCADEIKALKAEGIVEEIDPNATSEVVANA